MKKNLLIPSLLQIVRPLRNINIPLLVFLILFLNVKIVIKLVAILFIVAYTRNFKFGLSWKNSRLPLFYILLAGIELVKYLLITRNYTLNYGFLFAMGLFQWALAFMAVHQLRLFIDSQPVERTHATIKAFFLLNFSVSMFFLCLLVFQPSWLQFWGHGADISFLHPSAGDAILGISFDSSVVNATINTFGLIYFIYKREYLYSLFCVLIITLCTSNITFIIAVLSLALMFCTVREKKVRWTVFITGFVLVLSYIFISPANREYIRNYVVQLYAVNNQQVALAENKASKMPNPIIAEGIPVPVVVVSTTPDMVEEIARTRGTVPSPEPAPPIITASQIVKETTPTKRREVVIADSSYKVDNKKIEKAIANIVSIKSDSSDVPGLVLLDEDFETRPGKLISFLQTYNYLKSGVKNFFFGAGIGRFSSKLAFRAAGVSNYGSYPSRFRYVAPEFENNHLKTFNHYYNADVSQHSVLNYPPSVYNQLLGEYGFIGAALFAVFYLGFFLKRFKHLTYGKYITFLLLAFFTMEYWFEMFSVITLFELFLLLNLAEKTVPQKERQTALQQDTHTYDAITI